MSFVLWTVSDYYSTIHPYSRQLTQKPNERIRSFTNRRDGRNRSDAERYRRRRLATRRRSISIHPVPSGSGRFPAGGRSAAAGGCDAPSIRSSPACASSRCRVNRGAVASSVVAAADGSPGRFLPAGSPGCDRWAMTPPHPPRGVVGPARVVVVPPSAPLRTHVDTTPSRTPACTCAQCPTLVLGYASRGARRPRIVCSRWTAGPGTNNTGRSRSLPIGNHSTPPSVA